jgi:hypothetical protein
MLSKLRSVIRAIFSIQSKLNSIEVTLATIEHNEARLLERLAEIRTIASEYAELRSLKVSTGSHTLSGVSRFGYKDFIGSFSDHPRPPGELHLCSKLCQQGTSLAANFAIGVLRSARRRFFIASSGSFFHLSGAV